MKFLSFLKDEKYCEAREIFYPNCFVCNKHYLVIFGLKFMLYVIFYYFSDPFDDAFMLEMQSQAQDHSLLMQHYHLKVLDYQQVLVVQPKYDRSNPMFNNNTT